MNQIPDDAWEQTTWEGHRRAQLRLALGFTLRERLQAVEDMAEVAERSRQMRETDEVSATPAVNETPAVQQIPPRYDSTD